jgi:hypothetical protein
MRVAGREVYVSSRGHFLGQIIDDLDAIVSQVRQRCAVGQTDLNRVLEDFFKELLNLIHGSSLRNLNKNRSNAPGLDLGDTTSHRKRAYQVTSVADAAKVNKTLRTVSDKQIAAYDEIKVLVIGERQRSYKLDAALTKRCNFTENDIIGITELCREIMDLDMATIQAVHRKLADEQRRIRIELEPQINGKFATSILDMIEAHPSVTRSDATILAAHSSVDGLFDTATEAQQALDGFIDELQRLPRLTREFFGWMLDESDARQGVGAEGHEVNADYVEAKCANMPSFRAEIRLLDARGFIDVDQDESWKSAKFRLFFPGTNRTNLGEAFAYFMRAEGLSASSMFSTMNFGPFGPPVATAAPAISKAKPAKKITAKRPTTKRPTSGKRRSDK